MRKSLAIGEKNFNSKKEAISHYRKILNSYNYENSLSDNDYNDLIDLLDYDSSFYENEEEFTEPEDSINDNDNIFYEESEDLQLKLDLDEEIEEYDVRIIDIKVTRFNYSHKCFKIIYNNYTSEIFSYLMIIQRPKPNPEALFYFVCRNLVRKDIFDIKRKYFEENSVNGFVKCQETKILSKWEDLVIDHRQPNTFSIIVDRYKEINNINVNEVEYLHSEDFGLIFKSNESNKSFRNYHKEKANLRIVRKECNSSRTGLARIKRTPKDLIIK